METLRISTAGNVNDGKSTLIGRLLYELGAVKSDKLKAIFEVSQNMGFKGMDYSLLADGLMEERENSITIDVAHLYFSTGTKNYILADSPGHIEYTRNMITGCSNAHVFLILIDVQKGIADQTCLHAYIASMLRIPKVVVCINKLDTVGFKQTAFEEIRQLFFEYIQKLDFVPEVECIPISALYGDNVVSHSPKTPWYNGRTLIQTLETHQVVQAKLPLRFRIQHIVHQKKKNTSFYLGKVVSGRVYKNLPVVALPSGEQSAIGQIYKGEKTLQQAGTSESVCLTLARPLELKRGSLLVQEDQVPGLSKQIRAEICWFVELPGIDGGAYLLKHGMNTVPSKLDLLSGKKNVVSLKHASKQAEIHNNEMCSVLVQTEIALPFECFSENKANGCFVLIDERSNATVAVGIIQAINDQLEDLTK